MTTRINEATIFQKVATSEGGMISAGIKELKNNLSRYLSQVKKGEDILVTERGKAIARIIKEDSKDIYLREMLSPLIVKGIIKLPSQKIDRTISTPVKLPGKPVSEMVIEDRR
ncbi:MAG: type II toxin-antitoxin system prevent-host-death family antitoxin [Deltaproteobacteria bacterium]|nr:type II toxin-antitoxin system prevent-host-death family antitoxin [Deltaproteobacteria bacterium]